MEKIKVIIVDDNEEIAKLIRNYLMLNKEIEILGMCYSDEEEIRLIEDSKPDIVITDIVRNGINSGLDIIRNIKNKECNIKFLVISAFVLNAEDSKVIDGFIRKPITNWNVILTELKRIMGNI